MKSKYITHIILEGADGVGKDTIAYHMWQYRDMQFRVYVRGELSDYVYAKKYNRPFSSTQHGLPFLYVLLTCDKEELKNRIENRTNELDDVDEIKKVNDQDLFLDVLNTKFVNDYHVITFDVTNISAEDAAYQIYKLAEEYQQNLPVDEELTPYNEMYKKGCKKAGIKLDVRNNQPYFNNRLIMADAQLHNGTYETYNDKTHPHNLIFSLGYTNQTYNIEKSYDFCYIISSKLNVRQEVNDYFDTFRRHGKTCITKSTFGDKVFGDDYIKRISNAKATVYVSRDLAYLKMITVRPYEAVLANQILFVDKETDPENEILTQIYGDEPIKYKLYITPETICEQYDLLTKEEIEYILERQHIWYDTLCEVAI